MRKFLLTIFFLPFLADSSVLREIRHHFYEESQKFRLVLVSDNEAKYSQFALKDPPRLVFDFPKSSHQTEKELTFNKGVVAGLRIGYKDENTLRLVIDMRADSKADIFRLKPDENNQHRLVIDLYPKNKAKVNNPSPKKPPLSLTSINQPTEPTKPITSTPAVINPAPATITRKTQSSSANVKKASGKIVVCLDAGHGGKDQGASNKTTGALEKNVVLAIAKKTKTLLEKSGYKVVMTRNNDIYIPLPQRPQICRKNKGNLFISIHADAVESSEPSGSSVYILSTKGVSSSLAKYLAKTENANNLQWDLDISDYDRHLQTALLDMQMEATREISLAAAKEILNELGKIGNVHKKQVEFANFAVLRGSTEFPAVLVETAFISNLTEAKLLVSADYQEKLAKRIASGISAYFAKYPPQHILLRK